jgi:hypothetical protein
MQDNEPVRPDQGKEVQMSDSPDEARKRRGWEKIQRQLDEALDLTFPASDPVSIMTSEPAVPEPKPKPVPPRNP